MQRLEVHLRQEYRRLAVLGNPPGARFGPRAAGARSRPAERGGARGRGERGLEGGLRGRDQGARRHRPDRSGQPKNPRGLSVHPQGRRGADHARARQHGERGDLRRPREGAEGERFAGSSSLRYIKEGYIKDDDAKNWNADELLQNLKDGNEEANKDRAARGFPQMEVIGWVKKPTYDPATHRLVWSLLAKHKGEPDTANKGDQLQYLCARPRRLFQPQPADNSAAHRRRQGGGAQAARRARL